MLSLDAICLVNLVKVMCVVVIWLGLVDYIVVKIIRPCGMK